MHLRARTLAAAASILIAHVGLVLHGAASHSAVFDEVVYPTSGLSYLTTGDYRPSRDPPPLLKMWSALPWLGSGLSAERTPGWNERDEWVFGRAMLYASGRDPGALLWSARA